MLKLAFWNGKGIGEKDVELENMVGELEPDVLCVTETWIQGQDDEDGYHWPAGYRIICKSREKTKGGGVAWLIRNSIKVLEQKSHDPNEKAEWLAVKVVMADQEPLWLVGCYVPKGEVRWRANFLDQLKGERMLLCGDFNAKGPALPYKKDLNSSGREIMNIISTNQLILNGPFVPTHKLGGTLDLLLTSPDMFHLVDEIEVGGYYGSDHKVVSTSVKLETSRENATRFDYARGRWGMFKEIVRTQLKEAQFPAQATPETVDQMARRLVEILQRAANAAIPRVPAVEVRTWRSNREIAEVIKERHEYQRLRERTGMPIFGLLANRAHEKYRRLAKVAEEKALNSQLVQLERARRCDLNKFFKIINKLENEETKSGRGVRKIRTENGTATTDAQKAEILCRHLEQQFIPRTIETKDPDAAENRRRVEEILKEHQNELGHKPLASCQCDISISKQEIRDAIRKLKMKAPGEDGVSNMLLKKGGQTLENYMRRMFNLSLNLGYVPQVWKVAMVVPLPRPGKDLNTVGGYRPVSLLSVIGKLLEALLAARLSSDLERAGVIPKCQSAFRRKHSTVDQTFSLAQRAYMAKARKEVMVATFIDFEGAFNAVWHQGLRYKILTCKAIPEALTRWLSSFLENRSFKVRVGGTVSRSAAINAGVPQGSALSPILFSLFTADLPGEWSLGDAEVMMFADDVTATATACWPGLAAARVQKKIRAFQRWAERWMLPINPAKCQTLIFGNCRSDVRVFINGRAIPRVNSAKYLGITFDSKLTFEEHIETIVSKASSRMAILKRLSFKKQTSSQTKLLMFKAMIRPLWEYSCAAFIASSAAAIQKLQIVQNRCLRMCLNVTMYDRIKVGKLHEDLGIEMVADRFKNLAAGFGRRAMVYVPPVRALIQEHRKAKELKWTPLAMFITELDRDRGTKAMQQPTD